MKEQTYVSVVAYAHNDFDKVADFILQIDSLLYHHFAVYEIILVDDCSTDATLKQAFELKDAVKGNVTLVALNEQLGSHRALTAGTDLSIGDFIFEFDSLTIDFSLELLLTMYRQATDQGSDIIFAVPESQPWSWGSGMVKWLTRGKATRLDSQLRLVTRRALYAMTRQVIHGVDRNIAYQICGFNWRKVAYASAGALGERSSRRSSVVDLLLLSGDKPGILPFWLAGVFALAAVVTLAAGGEAAKYLASLIWGGFGLVFVTVGLLHRHLQLLLKNRVPSHYRVREVKRINRY